MEAKTSKGFVTYMLKCDNCQSVFESEDGFPERQLCPRCLIVLKAGIKTVVEWVEEHTCHIEEWTGWQEQKEEWEGK